MMSNHGDKPSLGAFRELLDKSMAEEGLKLGATGLFPEGRLVPEDEGELRLALSAAKGKVVLAFGKPIDWVGFPAEQARDLAQLMLDKAEECDGIAAKVRKLEK